MNWFVSLGFVYVVTLPLWLPPVLIARRSRHIGSSKRTAAVWLAGTSPLVALIGIGIGFDYCGSGSTAIGIGEGTFWPKCSNAWIAWVMFLTPASLMGLAGWVLALVPKRP